jgi:hypothetical protein
LNPEDVFIVFHRRVGTHLPDYTMYPQGKRSKGMKLTTYLHLVPRLRMGELYLHSPICLHGIALNYIIKYRDRFILLVCLVMKCGVFQATGRPFIGILTVTQRNLSNTVEV